MERWRRASAASIQRTNTKSHACSIAIRNIRRDENDTLKRTAKEESLSQDQEKKVLEIVQKLTDKYIAEVDKVFAGKEKEILTV